MSKKPVVCIVDDDGGDGFISTFPSSLKERGNVEVIDRHPRDVTKQDLEDADVVLVDFCINENWDERTTGPISKIPEDGVALQALLRRHSLDENDPPTAFGLITGKLDQLAAPLPGSASRHLLSRLLNVEWVFSKGDAQKAEQIESIAKAVKLLPPEWEPNKSIDQLEKLLNVKAVNETDLQLIRGDLFDCLPPIHEISSWSHGLAVIRWMLHRILPYPCFLMNLDELAVRLGIKIGSLASNHELEQSLRLF